MENPAAREPQTEGTIGADFFIIWACATFFYFVAMLILSYLGSKNSGGKFVSSNFFPFAVPLMIDAADLISDFVSMVLIVRENYLYELMISMFGCLFGHQILTAYMIWFYTNDVQCALYQFFGCRELLEIYECCRENKIVRKYHFIKPLRTIMLNHPYILGLIYYIVTHPVPKFIYLSITLSCASMCSRINFFDACGIADPRWIWRILIFVSRFFEIGFHVGITSIASYAFHPLPVYWFLWGQTWILIAVDLTAYKALELFGHRSKLEIVEGSCLHLFFINLFSDDIYAYLSNIFKVLELLVLIILIVNYGVANIHPNLAVLCIFSLLVVCTTPTANWFFRQCHCFDIYDYNAAISDNHNYFITLKMWPQIIEHLDRGILSPDPTLAIPLHKYANMRYKTLRQKYKIDLLDDFAGVKLEDLVDAGYTIKEIKDAGFTSKHFYKSGIDINKEFDCGMNLKDEFSLEDLKHGGYGLEDVLSSGATLRDAHGIGFSVHEMNEAGFGAHDLLDSGIQAEHVKEGFAPETARQRGLSAKQAIEAGYSIRNMRNGGYTAAELREIGITSVELGGIYSVREMRKGGYSAAQVNRIRGVAVADFYHGGYSVQEMRDIGYKAVDLKGGRYSCHQMRDGGYTLPELYAVGYTPTELRSAGYGALEMQVAGLTISNIRSAGFSTMDLRDAGLTIEELLKEVTVHELVRDGWSSRELRQAGVTWKQIVNSNEDVAHDTYTCLSYAKSLNKV